MTRLTRRELLVGGTAIVAAGALPVAAFAATTKGSGFPRDTSRKGEFSHDDDHDQRRHDDLLQRLGQGAACGVQPRMAAKCRCLGFTDVISWPARVSRHRSRPSRTWPFEPAVERK